MSLRNTHDETLCDDRFIDDVALIDDHSAKSHIEFAIKKTLQTIIGSLLMDIEIDIVTKFVSEGAEQQR